MISVSDLYSHEFGAELPEDLFLDTIADMFAQDSIIEVLKDRATMRDSECSRFAMIDYEKEEIHIGMRDYIDPYYIPEEDWSGVDVVYNYAKGEDRYRNIFPDVPIADCGIPSNQIQRPIDGYDLEKEMCKKGLVLYNPSVGCRINMGSFYSFVVDEGDLSVNHSMEYTYEELPVSDQQKEALFFFLPYRDAVKKNGMTLVSMQFNPFHPMAVSLIEDIMWDTEFTVSGHYLHRGKRIPFFFDIKDVRYRIHSDVWMQLLAVNTSCGFNEVFDLVCPKPFAHLFEFVEVDDYIEPTVVEPLYFLQEMDFPYSHITTGTAVRGMGVEWYYSSSYRGKFPVEKKRVENFREVTDEIQDFDGRSFFFRETRYYVKDKEVLDSDLFIKIKKKKDRIDWDYRVFRREKKDDTDIGKIFSFIEIDMRFLSFPRNVYGSIIYDFKAISLLDAIRLDKIDANIHEFLPLWSKDSFTFKEVELKDYGIYDGMVGREEITVNFDFDEEKNEVERNIEEFMGFELYETSVIDCEVYSSEDTGMKVKLDYIPEPVMSGYDAGVRSSITKIKV